MGSGNFLFIMKLHILDNGFAKKSGHNFEYTKSVYEEWVRRGNEAVIYCTQVDDGDVRGKFNLVPLFSVDVRESYSKVRVPQWLNKFLRLQGVFNTLAGNRSFLNDLKKIDIKSLSEGDVVLVHTLDQNSLFALYRWYRSLAPAKRPFFILLFRFTTMHCGDKKRRLPSYYFYKLMLKLLERLLGSEKIIFTTDSDALAEQYETMTQRKVYVLPIPHIPTVVFREPNSSNDEKVFVYIGEANERKGYHLLPEAIDFVMKNRAHRKVRFLLQSNCPRHPEERVLQAKKELSAMGDPIEIVDRVLDTTEYYGLLASADAVLIPYVAESYRAQTSGIFAEALAFGRSVIVPKDTWMGREFTKYKSGGVLFNENGKEALGMAILSFLQHSEESEKRADLCRIDWIQYHNPKNYVDILLGVLREKKSR